MFARNRSTDNLKSDELLSAIGASQAIISFRPDGTILTANANFLSLMGYRLDEVEKQHHSMFVDASEKDSAAYANFWAGLRSGQSTTAEFRRKTKSGAFVWIQGCYSPVTRNGQVIGVVKVASDITARKLASADALGQLSAIDKAQATIEFDLNGIILTANKGFCAAMGYEEGEIVGRHHSIFVDPAYAKSPEYAAFWKTLQSGQYQASEFCRLAKSGAEVWIQATYNPIFDQNGAPYKVVKFATDVTSRKYAVREISRVLLAMAAGDLTQSLPTPFDGEMEGIRQALNTTMVQISGIVSRLLATSATLRTATAEIMLGANDLSDRTGKQAASIEEISASMADLSETVQANSARTASAKENSNGVLQQAEDAGRVMVAADNTMNKIADSSDKISNIIGLIDDIAFQTNLLALNASVEAARAGDSGRGFAIVAAEVRRLAQSAAKSSSEINTLVQSASSEVQEGARLVEDAKQKLQAVVSGLVRTDLLTQEIADATSEQAAAIFQMSTAIVSIDEMTQQNAALVEQTNASIEQTENQAVELDMIVDIFDVGVGISVEQSPQRARQRA